MSEYFGFFVLDIRCFLVYYRIGGFKWVEVGDWKFFRRVSIFCVVSDKYGVLFFFVEEVACECVCMRMCVFVFRDF